MAADPIWKKKLMEALGFTPRYDIDIGRWGKTGQHGKIDRRILERWAKDVGEGSNLPGGGGASGLHPGVESGYQGGLTRAGEVSPQFEGNWWDRDAASRLGHWGAPSTRDEQYLNKPPTQVGWNKPSIKGGAGGGFKRVLKHLGAMESPGPDWSLEAKNVGVQSPWGISNAPWEALSPGRAWLERKKKEELA